MEFRPVRYKQSLGSISASNNLAVGGNLDITGTITLGEVSSAPTPGTDEGVIYVKSDGKLYYKGQSEGNTELELGAGTISSYTNPSNNRVVTSVDSSTVNAEASLTFDGTTLKTLSGGHVSSSGDVYALGALSASNNLAVGGNAQVSGSLSASLMYAHAVANAQSWPTMTIPTNYNSVLYGPISIDASQTVTINVDSNVAIVDIADA